MIISGDTSSYNLPISDYDKAIEMNPRLAMAYNNRGFACVKKGEYKV
jgi:hypothetical protein